MLRAYAAAVVFSLASVSSFAAGASASALANIRIDNFGQVSDSYFRGAQPVGDDYASLAAIGVKTVIDLTDEDASADEPRLVTGLGMKSLRIPMSTRETPSAEKIGEFLQIVNDPANQPVYVHCVGGRHRTGVMTAVFRMTHDGWTADQAFAEMKKYKFGADFLHPEFKKFVYAFNPAAKPALPTVVATQVPIR